MLGLSPWRRAWFRNGWWWGDAFAAWLIGEVGGEPANIIEKFLDFNEPLRIKEALDARLD